MKEALVWIRPYWGLFLFPWKISVFLFLSKIEHLFLSGAIIQLIDLFSFKNSTKHPKSPSPVIKM